MEIQFEEGREKLIEGINKLSKAVGKTMGPNGKTVIIPDTKKYGQYRVTKDGVSVANAIQFLDPIENIGADLIKKAAQKTVDEAGDGTTTSTVLASAFVNNLKDFNSNEINKAFDEIIPKVLEQLKINSRELKREDIHNVATISANGDIQIGNIIQQAFDHADIVKVEEGNQLEDRLDLKTGMSLPVSYLSSHFVTNERKQECDMIEPYVILVEGKVESLKGFEFVIKQIAQENKNLLIITEHVHENILRLLESNKLSGSLNICVMKAPGFGGHRFNLLKDLAVFTGATIIKDCNNPITFKEVGILKSCNIGKHNSILVKPDNRDITEYISILEGVLTTDLSEHEKDLVKQRIEYLIGKLSIIIVGGKEELEVSERKDRYDDAVLAVACALEEGIVEGAGVALLKAEYEIVNIYTSDLNRAILNSLEAPNIRIIKNGTRLHKDQNEDQIVIPNDLFSKSIIDPLKVTRCALLNAVSIAKTILSTDAIVLHESQWKRN